MSQTDINILLRATDQASNVIDTAASKLSGSMTKIEDANKKVTDASDKVNISSKQMALAFNNIATSGMALYNAYARVKEMEVQMDRANLMVNSTLNSLNDAQRRYSNAVLDSGVSSEKAKVAAADLSVAQERYQVACERAQMTQNSLNQTIAQAAMTVIPSVITAAASLNAILVGLNLTTAAGEAVNLTNVGSLIAEQVAEYGAAIAEGAHAAAQWVLNAALMVGISLETLGVGVAIALAAAAAGVATMYALQARSTDAVSVSTTGANKAQIAWLQSFEDLKKIAPETANAINGFTDACYRSRTATDNLDTALGTLNAEYKNAKKAIEDQINSLSVLTVVEMGHAIESGKESERNKMIEDSVRRLRAEMDSLDQSYANATEEIKKKIVAQEEERKTQELLASLIDTYNLSVAKASLTMNTYGQAFQDAFGAGRISEALDVAKNFAAQFSISINDAIRTLQDFSGQTTDTFSNLSDAAKEYLTGQAQDNVQKFKDCATNKLELLKKKIDSLDIFEAIRISAGNFTGVTTTSTSVTTPTAATAAIKGATLNERLDIYLSRLGLAEGGIVTQPTLALVGEEGPEAVIPLEKVSHLQDLTGLGGQAQRLGTLQEILQKYLQRRGMAEGGIVTQPTLTWVGERGPEAIIPLDKAGSGLGNITIQINVTGAVDRATADYAVNQMKSALENVIVEASSVSGPSTHKRIRYGD